MPSETVERLICAASEPDSSFYEQLAGEMRKLDISPPQGTTVKPSQPDLVADLETLVEEVVRVVNADALENTLENLPCEFEYQLVWLAKPMNHIKVLTRLFKEGDHQSIFYGRSIVRLADQQFALWVE